MNDTPRSDKPPANADDDQRWLDLVAGRAVDDAHGATRREAAWLRAALLSYRAEAPEGTPSPAGPRAERLVARARSAGVLPPQDEAPMQQTSKATTAPARPGGHHRHTRSAWAWALAASLAGLTLFGTLRWAGVPGSPDAAAPADTLRGASQQQRHSAKPLADRDLLLLQLRSAGFDARPYERLGRPAIDLDLPVPLSAAQRQALARMQIAPPAGPSLQIEFQQEQR